MANFKDLSLLVLEARKIDNKIIITKNELDDKIKKAVTEEEKKKLQDDYDKLLKANSDKGDKIPISDDLSHKYSTNITQTGRRLSKKIAGYRDEEYTDGGQSMLELYLKNKDLPKIQKYKTESADDLIDRVKERLNK